jgi:hypothetical protein
MDEYTYDDILLDVGPEHTNTLNKWKEEKDYLTQRKCTGGIVYIFRFRRSDDMVKNVDYIVYNSVSHSATLHENKPIPDGAVHLEEIADSICSGDVPVLQNTSYT